MIGTVPEGLSGDDHPFIGSPWVDDLPPALRRVVLDLTYDEVHAMELSLLAWPLTAFWFFGGPIVDLIIGIALLMVLGVVLFKLPRESGLAAELLGRETWYFLVPFTIQSGLAFAILLVVV